MEARVMKMESELRVLRAAMAQVPHNVLRELAARGALLVVQASTAELEDVVAKALEEEEEEEKKKEAAVVVEKEEEEEEKAEEEEEAMGGERVVKESEAQSALEKDASGGESTGDEEDEEDEDSSDDSSDSELEEAEDPVHPVQRCEEVETSQESAASGPVAESTREPPLSLSAFNKAITASTPPVVVSTVPSRPPAPFAPASQPSAAIRPLVLARRPAPEPTEVTPPRATSKPTPVRPFVPPPPKTQAVVMDVPANFEVQTKDSVPVAWEKWCCGDSYHGFPPLRLVTSKHVVNKAVLRRLSDLRCAMLPIETLAKEEKLWSESLTPQQAALIFQQLEPQLPLSKALPSGRERKKEIAWSTALNLMRRGKKRKQPPQQIDNDGFISETLI